MHTSGRSGRGSTNAAERNIEAQTIRQDAATLGTNAHIIYAGDFNLYGSSEIAWTSMTAAGVGAATDPANQVGAWHDNAAYAAIGTQAPAVTPPAGFASGGLNDRFDYELATRNVTSGSGGLTFVPGTYHTFGNNGSVAIGGNINDPGSTALLGLSDRTDILNDLTTQSDHLPVIADYAYSAMIGDANADGTIDLNDLNIVLNNLGNATSSWSAGNFDGASTIDLNDLNDVLNNLGVNYVSSSSVAAAGTALHSSLTAAPEPLTAAILLPVALCFFGRRKL